MSQQSESFMEILDQWFHKLNGDELEEAALTAKLIWRRRNSVTHGKGFTHPNLFIKKAKEDLQAFMSAQDNLFSPRPNTMQMAQPWEKPPIGSYKVNWDATIDKSRGKIGKSLEHFEQLGY